VHSWTDALVALRELLSESELTEEMKWGSPCYTLNGKNVVAIAARKDCCALSFFKGAILKDPRGVLEAPGPSSRYARTLKFTSAEDVAARRVLAAQLVAQAIEVERSGKKVAPAPANEPMPDELQAALDADPALAEAYGALTPGRRRSHILYVSGAKQSQTRHTRAERCAAKILAGKGYNER
jgi:uncharacterized protein YdeI (YjbR/CyaY-like superfamily)